MKKSLIITTLVMIILIFVVIRRQSENKTQVIQQVATEYNFINEAVTKFANQWLKEEIKNNPGKNIIVSPVSVYLALSILTEGADEKAYDELSKILGTKDVPLWLFNKNLQTSSALYSKYAKITNSIWGNKFEREFKKEVKKNLNAEIKKLPETIQPINDWINEKTEGQIPTILSQMPLDKKDGFLLINTVYFNAEWRKPFKKEETTKKDFYTPTGVVSVDMMQKTEPMPYYEDDIMQAAILFYKGEQDISSNYDMGDYMTIYLPKEGIHWNDFISHLSENNFNFQFKDNQEVQLGLPRFDADYSVDTLMGTLKKWNITSIFNDGHLEKMAKNAVVKDIFHKARVKVDEQGTVASAVTAISDWGSDIPVIFWANHPFLFKINEALFVGVIMNPNE